MLSIVLFLIIHCVSCLWLYVGEARYLPEEDERPPTWIYNPESGLNYENDAKIFIEATEVTKYITSFYWVVTTLTTVGYGDYKGFTNNEYTFTYIVEFIGILFFSIMMGSINTILENTDGDLDITDQKLESVDVWLVKLDNSRMSK